MSMIYIRTKYQKMGIQYLNLTRKKYFSLEEDILKEVESDKFLSRK